MHDRVIADPDIQFGETVEELDIVIPCFNPNRSLLIGIQAIDEACELYHLKIAITIFDDCSYEGIEIYDEIKIKAARLTIHKNQRNLGEGANLNTAIASLAQCGRRWFLLLHQDDFIQSGWLLYCLECLRVTDPPCPPMVHALYQGVQASSLKQTIKQSIVRLSGYDVDARILAGRPGLDYISRYWQWVPSGTLMRVDKFLAVGGFHPGLKFAGDCDFLVRWLLGGLSIKQVDLLAILKTVHAASQTSRAVLSGADNEGYCYLMVRYGSLRSRTDNVRAHFDWMLGNLRSLVGSIWRGDFPMIRSRSRGAVLVLSSLTAILCPRMQFLLPYTVKLLLHYAPPIVRANETDAAAPDFWTTG